MRRSSVQDIISRIYGYLVKFDVVILLGFLAISMLQIWRTRYVPSLDGPQHLYNAQVLTQLLRGNDLFQEFFRINPVVVGYWTGHFFLGFFKLFLPAWLAEKFFLTAYVVGMFFSFRYLIRGITRQKENLLVYLIFPFIFHNYLLLGYYSFCIAAIFFFWAFGYWIRKKEAFKWKEMIVFGALVLGVFLSHALVFLFFGVAFLLYFAGIQLHDRVTQKPEASWQRLGNLTWRLALSVLPAVILWIIYIRSVMDINPTVTPAAYSLSELVQYLLRIRQLVGFSHEVESPAYILLFVNLMVLSLAALYAFIQKRQRGEGHWIEVFDSIHGWITLSLLFLIAYLLLPDRISAGSLTHRFGLYFFLALIVFLASFPAPRILQMATLVVLLVVTGMARHNHRHFLENLTEDILDIREMSVPMEEGSTVLSLNASGNWIHTHFQLYAAGDKKLVHLNNPQCAGQFPIIWNQDKLPACFVGDQPYVPGGAPDVSGKGQRSLQVDYITIWHQQAFWENQENTYWHQVLNDHYQEVLITNRNLGALYQRMEP